MFTVLVPLPTLVRERYMLMGAHEAGSDGVVRFMALSGHDTGLSLMTDSGAPYTWAAIYLT